MAEHTELLDKIEEIAVTLERWANESHTGGWSTHQVDAQRALAAELWAISGRERRRRRGGRPAREVKRDV